MRPPGRVRVKICGVTSPADARMAAAAGADAIGLVFHPPSPRFVDPGRARAIVRVLPPWVAAVGVFVDPDPLDVATIVRLAGLSAAQLHGDEPADLVRALRGIKVIKAFRIGRARDLGRSDGYPADAYLFDSRSARARGGTGEALPWRLLSGRRFARPVILAGGLHPGNVALAIRRVRPFGVDASSGVERRPGVKDAGRVRAFVREALAACSL